MVKHPADMDSAFRQRNDVRLSEPFSHFDIRHECCQITALLLVQGANDDYSALRQLDEVADAVPCARQCWLANFGQSAQCGHATLLLQAVTALLKINA